MLLGELKMTKQTKLSDFIKGVAEEDEKHSTPNADIEDRVDLKAEFDTVYENYIVESYTSDIPSNFDGKTNTIVRMTSPAGDKVQMWVGSYEQDHFQQKVASWQNQGHELPVKISFARVKVPSKKDASKSYNRLKIQTVAMGPDVAQELLTL